MSKRDPNNPNWGDPKHFQYFSQHRIDLAQEVKKHPPLMELLNNHPQDEFEVLIAEISAYCQVGLDGDYTQEDLDDLSRVLYEKLLVMRTGIVFARDPNNVTPIGGH